MNRKRMSPKEYMLIYGDDDEKKDVECDILFEAVEKLMDKYKIPKVKIPKNDEECKTMKSEISKLEKKIKKIKIIK
jgi:hypothetical protein